MTDIAGRVERGAMTEAEAGMGDIDIVDQYTAQEFIEKMAWIIAQGEARDTRLKALEQKATAP